MRTATFVSFVPALLLGALVCVADEVPVAPTPPAEAQNATTEAPTQPAAAAADAPAEATAQEAIAKEATEKEATDGDKMEEDVLRKQGYKVKTVNGEKRYCKKENVLGSRLNAQTICWTADQIKANKEDADILREKQGQRQTF